MSQDKKAQRKKAWVRRKKWLAFHKRLADFLVKPPGGLFREKSKFGLTEKEIDWIRWRYEFMRRDPNYKQKFRQEYPVDLGKSFEEILAGENEWEIYINYLRLCYWLFPKSPIRRINNEPDKLELCLDFSGINSIDAAKKEVEDLIDVCWAAYLKKTGRKTVKMKDFGRLLQVGDLRAKGFTFLDIGKRVFPHEVDIAETRAKQDYKEYKRLIKGGWREITYP